MSRMSLVSSNWTGVSCGIKPPWTGVNLYSDPERPTSSIAALKFPSWNQIGPYLLESTVWNGRTLLLMGPLRKYSVKNLFFEICNWFIATTCKQRLSINVKQIIVYETLRKVSLKYQTNPLINQSESDIDAEKWKRTQESENIPKRYVWHNGQHSSIGPY